MNASSLPTPGRLLFDELLLQPNLRLRVGEHIVDIGAQDPGPWDKGVAARKFLIGHCASLCS